MAVPNTVLVPVTRPPDATEAVPAALLLHVPLPVASLNCVVEPSQTILVPVIATGNGLTVTPTVPVPVCDSDDISSCTGN